MNKSMQQLYRDLRRKLGKNKVFIDELFRVANAADAGCYQKIPQLVAEPSSEEEVRYLLRELYQISIPLTFRAGGTSLSGQAISDSVLLKAAGDNWSKTEVLDEGHKIRTQVGITGNRLNQILKPWNRKFGPDPASVNSAMVGGIIANNAAGMSCGIHASSYATIRTARIILADGTLLDTENEQSRRDFISQKAELVEELLGIRDEIRKNEEFVSFIRKKYSIKNTTGYALNAFLDYDDPLDILLHLMVGSEGTLGFISEAVFDTVPLLNFRASSLLYFKSLEDAIRAVAPLKDAGVPAIELMDREALRSVENQKGIPGFIKDFGSQVSALLIDLEAESEEDLEQLIKRTEQSLEGSELERDFELTRDPGEILNIWKVRKGVFPSVGGMRKPGTAVIIEDIAVETKHLKAALIDLRRLLDKHDYRDAVIYGHALDGNLHFIFAQDFEDKKELEKYDRLITELADLIVNKYQGSLKAEHGTGLNMAPFVEYEWGKDLYQFMMRIKNIFDPANILNPGVIINEDPRVHLKNFKKLPEVDESVDRCIECGFCEINCLTTGFTLSARQRIVVQRHIKQLLRNGNNTQSIRKIEKDFKYSGDKTCAGDGLCSLTCPLDIDTGVMIKNLRNEKLGKKSFASSVASRIAENFSTTLKFVRTGLDFVAFMQRMLGNRIMRKLGNIMRTLTFRRIPAWNKNMPQGASFKSIKKDHADSGELRVVYYPSCINQVMGPSGMSNRKESLIDVTVRVLERAGYTVIFPENMDNLCCGTPWESKGFFDIADMKSSQLEMALLKASKDGEIPVLCDTSPCVYRMKKFFMGKLMIYEPFEFIHDFLMDKLKIEPISNKMAFHITCSSAKMYLDAKFHSVASWCVEQPVFPEEVGCCGFAGDKGFSLPEMNSWALRKLNTSVIHCERGFSNSRTCEIGLSEHSGINYQSIMYLVDEVSSANDKISSESMVKNEDKI